MFWVPLVSRMAGVEVNNTSPLTFGDHTLLLPSNLQPMTVYEELRIMDNQGVSSRLTPLTVLEL